MNPIHSILVPADFSVRSTAALNRAMELAHRFQAAVEVLHVVEVPLTLGGPHGTIATSVLEEVRHEGVEAAEAALAKLLRDVPHADTVTIRTKVLSGNPRTVICDWIEAEKPDLVVIATEGRTGVSRFLIGSVAERIVRSAACPVLTWRPSQEESAA